METKTTTSRVVISSGQFFRERKDAITVTVDETPVEVSRTSTLGRLFRKVADGETPTDRILEDVSYEVLNLVLVEEAAVSVEEAAASAMPEVPVQDEHCDTCCSPVRAKSVARPKIEKAVVAPVVAEAPAAVAETKVSSKSKLKKTAAKAKLVKKVVAKAKSKSKATTSGTSGRSGQSGPVIDKLLMDELNKKERKVLVYLSVAPKAKILEIALGCFSTQPKPRRSSWVRNSLRRLVRASLVEWIDSGTYRLTARGRRQVMKAA